MEESTINTIVWLGLIVTGALLAKEGWSFFLQGCKEIKNTKAAKNQIKVGLFTLILGITITSVGAWIFTMTIGKDQLLIDIIVQKWF